MSSLMVTDLQNGRKLQEAQVRQRCVQEQKRYEIANCWCCGDGGLLHFSLLSKQTATGESTTARLVVEHAFCISDLLSRRHLSGLAILEIHLEVRESQSHCQSSSALLVA